MPELRGSDAPTPHVLWLQTHPGGRLMDTNKAKVNVLRGGYYMVRGHGPPVRHRPPPRRRGTVDQGINGLKMSGVVKNPCKGAAVGVLWAILMPRAGLPASQSHRAPPGSSAR